MVSDDLSEVILRLEFVSVQCYTHSKPYFSVIGKERENNTLLSSLKNFSFTVALPFPVQSVTWVKLSSLHALPSHIKPPLQGIFTAVFVPVPSPVAALSPPASNTSRTLKYIRVYLINTDPKLSVGLTEVSLLDFWKLFWLSEWKTESSEELPFLIILMELTAVR